ncbi:MAG TPA: hypothetical protein ENO20_10470, partial [Bacteroides sp.]|nr:hypothetical protein [Bacteroides sp.]
MKRFAPLIIVFFLIILYAFRGQGSSSSQSNCLECHADLVQKKVIHPITEAGCEFCHSSTGEKHPGNTSGFEFKAAYPDMCTHCHDSKNNMKSVHSPVEEGDCSICHDPHGSGYPFLILDDYSENACLDCHYVETESAVSVHGPVRNGKCQQCHDPHQTDHPNQLEKETGDLCMSCHSEEIDAGDRKVRDISTALVHGNVVHGPIKNESCIICHTPHSGDYPFQLVADYPVRQYTEASVANFELCFNCHDSELLTEPQTMQATNFRNGDKNMHYLHIQGNRGRNCNLCHN